MTIRITCPGCAKGLNVPDGLAGKKGKCPKCGAKFTVPVITTETGAMTKDDLEPFKDESPSSTSQVSQPPKVEDVAATENSVDPLAIDGVWYVRTPAGEQLGPITSSEARVWLNEGRIAPEAYVWREGWPDWRQASTVFRRGAETAISPPAPPTIGNWLDVSGSETPAGSDASAPEFDLPLEVAAPEAKPVAPPRRKVKGPSLIAVGICAGLAALTILLVVLFVMRINRYRKLEAEVLQKQAIYDAENAPSPAVKVEEPAAAADGK